VTFGRSELFPRKAAFLSAHVLAKRPVTSPQTIKKILRGDLRMAKLTRRWVPQDLNLRDKGKRVVDARTLLQELINDQDQKFSHIITGDEGWFSSNYESPIMFARARDEAVPRVSPIKQSKKAMTMIFCTDNRLLRLVYLPQQQERKKEPSLIRYERAQTGTGIEGRDIESRRR
jgi:hypothetical protein